MTFQVTAAAKDDVVATARFYNSRPGRYGSAFKAEFTAAARAIAAAPQMNSLVADEYQGVEAREFFIARFSQRVIYTVDGDDVTVIAVVHASRREGSWHRRLSGDA